MRCFTKSALCIPGITTFALILTVFLPVLVSAATSLTLQPTQSGVGTQVRASGGGFPANDTLQIWFNQQDTGVRTTTNAQGNFGVNFTVPNVAPGTYPIYALDGHNYASASFTVGTIDLQSLSISSLLQTPYAGASVTFEAFIHNNGSLPSGGFNIQWIADGKSVYGGHNSIPAGATDTHDYVWNNITAGPHTLTFIANFDYLISESNYNNNQVTLTFTANAPNYAPGKYAGKAGVVGVSNSYFEPIGDVNYCGPGASQVLISAWTNTVPDIGTLAKEEHTISSWGTYIDCMIKPINDAIHQTYYSINYAGTKQEDFSNMIGREILDNHHPLITGIKTQANGYTLGGWDHPADHIITIYGFDFRSPTKGYIYYYETANTDAGETKGPGPKLQEYNSFWSLVNNPQNNVQLTGNSSYTPHCPCKDILGPCVKP